MMRARPPLPHLADDACAEALAELLPRLGVAAPADPRLARRRLRAVLTVAPPGAIPSDAWPLLEELYAADAARREVTVAADLARVASRGWGARVSLWHGDITRLAVDAVVNAANAGLTGCYVPEHGCVDNAIHAAAGPWLREECGRIMRARGRPEPTATATITDGYFLPAGRVVHTVGPIVGPGGPTDGDAALLRRSYAACLDAAAAHPAVASLALCGISTGRFGYPVPRAAPVALAAVRELLERDERLGQVVIVTFTAAERAAYASVVEEALHA